MTDLHVDAFGEGIPAMFVHGSFSWGLDIFARQQALADGHRVILLDRRGFGASPPSDRLGWPTDMHDVAALLEELGGARTWSAIPPARSRPSSLPACSRSSSDRWS